MVSIIILRVCREVERKCARREWGQNRVLPGRQSVLRKLPVREKRGVLREG